MHWVPDLTTASAAYRRAGLPLYATPFAPAPGARSATWWDGRGYIEALSLDDRDVALAPSAYGELPAAMMDGIDAALATGGGVANTVFEVADTATAAAEMRAAGISVDTAVVTLGRRPRSITLSFAWPVAGPRWSPILLHYSLPRWLRTTAEGLKRRRYSAHPTLAGVVIETPDPSTSSDWLAAVLGSPAQREGTTVRLNHHYIEFTTGHADALTAVRLQGPRPPDTTIAGLRLEPANSTT